MTDVSTVLPTLVQAAMHPLTGAMFLLLAVAAVSDARSYRIPNWLTLCGVVYGLACNALLDASLWQGFMFGLQGLLLCFALTVPMYALSRMGAGDVKLIAMVGAFLGAQSAVPVILSMFIAGGAVALLVLLARRVLSLLLYRFGGMLSQVMAVTNVRFALPFVPDTGRGLGKLPFGVGIAAGTVGFVVLRQLGRL